MSYPGIINIILNPSSGGNLAGRSRALLESRLSCYGLSYQLHISHSEEHLRQLTRQLASGSSILAGAGGDSTLTIMAHEMMVHGLTAKLAMIGLGSSNDLMLEYNMASIDQSCQAMLDNHSQRIDVGQVVSGHQVLAHFLGQANVGLGALVNGMVAAKKASYPRLWRNQTLAGLASIIQAFGQGKAHWLLALDAGQAVNTTIALFSKIRYWATGKLFVPQAKGSDGLLHAVIVEQCTLPQFLRLALKASDGRHTCLPMVKQLSQRRFELRSPEPISIQVDGDLLTQNGQILALHRVEFVALPQALELIIRAN